MEITVENDYATMSGRAADWVAARVRGKPDMTLCLATGKTPLGMYARLGEKCAEGELDFSQTIIFNLDEYLGLPENHPGSCRFYIKENFLDKINARSENVFLISGENYAEYEAEIRRRGGIDLQILGIGRNGHVGFNEPGSAADSRTRVVKIAETTIKDNAYGFGGEDKVPKRAVTLGIGTILEAREILLLASGAAKAEATAGALRGPVSPALPASLLQKHPNLIAVLDEAAASKLAC